MLRRSAIVILVLLNLGAAGWWLAHPAAPTATAPTSAMPSLRLVGESAQPTARVSATTPDAVVSVVATMTTPAVTTPSTPPASPDATCLRFGPFDEAGARERARTALVAAGVAAVARDLPSGHVRGWNVFLPPLPTHEEAQAVAAKLKAAGITDLMVLNKGAETNAIALGRFSSEASAQRRQQALQAKGVAAQIAAVGGAPAQAWLEARLPAGVDRQALVRIAPAQPLDCARLR